MDRLAERGGLRAIAAALAAFAFVLFGVVTPSAASTYVLNYTGTVTSTAGIGGGVFAALGVTAGDAVSGTMTLGAFNPIADSSSGGNASFNQTSTSFTFHVSHPGPLGGEVTLSDLGNYADIVTAGTPHSVSGMRFTIDGTRSDLELTFQTDATGGPLTSLVGLPASPTALVAMFGGTSPRAYGSFSLNHFGTVFFDIAFNAAAVTPIPAALPLFASALGGLGLLNWRRRKAGRAADQPGALLA